MLWFDLIHRFCVARFDIERIIPYIESITAETAMQAQTQAASELISACAYFQKAATPGNSRLVYDHLVDYLYDSDCHSGGMFESYGVLLDFVAIEKAVTNAFDKNMLLTLVEVLRNNVYTPLALVLASYLEARVAQAKIAQ